MNLPSSDILYPISTLRIGTRSSPLAMAQANMVKAALIQAHPALTCDIVAMTTSGDRFVDRPLSEFGGKGLFTKELEEGLYARTVDIAVHSIKDMQTVLPDGLIMPCVFPREDARDLLICTQANSIMELRHGAVVGSSSLRRSAQLLHLRPDLQIVPFRGNVQTRLKKLENGVADATLLAVAGLKRLQMDPLPGTPIPMRDMLPAAGQGAVGIECRAEDDAIRALLAPLNHAESFHAITAERAMLRVLDGSCRTPIAAFASIEGERLRLHGKHLSDGKLLREHTLEGTLEEAESIGEAVGAALKY